MPIKRPILPIRASLLSLSSILILAIGVFCSLPAEAGALGGTTWQLAGQGTGAARADTFINFSSGGRLSGRSGCNRLSGAYREKGASLKIGLVISTRMACEPAVMRAERQFLIALSKARSFRLNGSQLALYRASGKLLLKLKRRKTN